ncbi:hypothetical protein BGX26_010135 [Mortierella sp. AD094]|nr:hypothetical protein BGX26_010135 [Mortierella sp. AD094]
MNSLNEVTDNVGGESDGSDDEKVLLKKSLVFGSDKISDEDIEDDTDVVDPLTADNNHTEYIAHITGTLPDGNI